MKPAWMDEAPVPALLAALARGGIAARFVGGCVRDTVLGRPVKEIDIAVDKPPETVMRALEAADLRVVPTGLSDLVDRLASDGVPAVPVRLP